MPNYRRGKAEKEAVGWLLERSVTRTAGELNRLTLSVGEL
jgi:hypothetical protein